MGGHCVACVACTAVSRAVDDGVSIFCGGAPDTTANRLFVLAGRPFSDEASGSVVAFNPHAAGASQCDEADGVVLAVDLDGDPAATCPLFQALLDPAAAAAAVRDCARHVHVENADLLTAADFDAVARVAPYLTSMSLSACEVELGPHAAAQRQRLFPATCAHLSLELHGAPMPSAVLAACLSAQHQPALRVLDLTLHQGVDASALLGKVDFSASPPPPLEQLAWRDHAAGTARSIQLPPIALAAIGAALVRVDIPFGCTPQHLAACAYAMPLLTSATVGGPALTNAAIVELLCENAALRHLAVLRAPAVSRQVALLGSSAGSSTSIESLELSDISWDDEAAAAARERQQQQQQLAGSMTDEALAAFFTAETGGGGGGGKWPSLRTLRLHEAVPGDIPERWRRWLLDVAHDGCRRRDVEVTISTRAHKAVM